MGRVPRATQARSTETRRLLLGAAAAAIARHGFEGASVDAIAEAAGRTSGSVYGQFGSKEGLVIELLDEWKDDVSSSIAEAMADAAGTLDDQLRALWRSFAQGGGVVRDWVRLEHELLRWATRDPDGANRARLAERYRGIWALLVPTLEEWTETGLIVPPLPPERLAPMVVGVLMGLELEHRVDPDMIEEDTVVATLVALLGAGTGPAGATTARPSTSSTRTRRPRAANTSATRPRAATERKRT
jgi:AcrR family transcriptional regulator